MCFFRWFLFSYTLNYSVPTQKQQHAYVILYELNNKTQKTSTVCCWLLIDCRRQSCFTVFYYIGNIIYQIHVTVLRDGNDTRAESAK